MTIPTAACPTTYAVVGMAGRFPGPGPGRLWRNVRDGVESVRQWTHDELRADGVSEVLLSHPTSCCQRTARRRRRVRRRVLRPRPKEAAIMDPQHRHFLECAWEALEDAGYPPERFDGVDRRVRRLRHERLLPVQPPDEPTTRRRARLVPAAPHRQRQGLPDDPRQLRARPHGARASTSRPPARTSLVAVHLAVPEPAGRRVRHGARRRRDDRVPARPRLPLPGGRDPVARRALPGLRSPRRQGTVFGAARASSCCGAWATPSATATRSSPSSRARPSTTTAADKIGYLAPERRRPGRRRRRGARGRRRRPAHDRPTSKPTAPAPRSAIPIEVAALTEAFRDAHRRRGLLPARLDQDQHRPPRHRRRRGEPDQGRAGAPPPQDAAERQLQAPNPLIDFDRRRSAVGQRSPVGRRRTAAGGRQLARRRRHQRPRDRRGGPRYSTPSAAARRSSSCSRRDPAAPSTTPASGWRRSSETPT